MIFIMDNIKFIKKAKEIHGDKYDYSKVEYKNSNTKVCIICPEHGEFWQLPYHHLHGCGCSKCRSKKMTLTTEEFIERAKEIHGDKYDYSKTEYVDNKTKICIICPIHGEFWQIPLNHLQNKGCPYCGKTKKYTTKEFIEKVQNIHGNKYDYSKIEYNGSNSIIEVICEKHGSFFINARSFLRGYGCIMCANEKRTMRVQDFIKKAKEIHGNKYDYSKVVYKNSYTPVCIICPEHGEFWQLPSIHLRGCGCPICNQSRLENEVKNKLNKENIRYIQQCGYKTYKWLGKQTLDFYLPDYNIAIECQGIQHFKPVEYFGGEEMFKKQRIRDYEKFKLCIQNNIKIFYYSNIKNVSYFEKIYNDINILFQKWLKI